MESDSPYRELLGDAWDSLPPGVRLAHSPPLEAEGTLRVTRASRGIGGLVARLIQLPAPGEAVPTSLSLACEGDTVEWVRTFGGMRAVSHQRIRDGRVFESAGPFEIELALTAANGTIRHRQTGLRLFGLRVPIVFGPRVTGEVEPGPDDASWHLDVRIAHPLTGTLCGYSGIMRRKIMEQR